MTKRKARPLKPQSYWKTRPVIDMRSALAGLESNGQGGSEIAKRLRAEIQRREAEEKQDA